MASPTLHLHRSRPGRQYILIVILPVILLLLQKSVPVNGLPKFWEIAENEGTIWAEVDETQPDGTPDELPDHKIIPKSVIPTNASHDVPEDEATGENVKVRHIESGDSRNMPFPSPLSSTVIHLHRGKGQGEVPKAEAGSSSKSEFDEKMLSFVQGEKSHEEDVEAEDQITQDVKTRRLNGKSQLRLRNSSELHIDNHNETSQDETKNISKSSPDFLPKVVYLQKPFHFHIPITIPSMSGEGHPESSHVSEVGPQQQDHRSKANENDERGPRDPSTFVSKRGTVTGPAPEASKSEQDQNPDQPIPSLNTQDAKYDIGQLIDQYPKLIPSINRKRFSGKGNPGLDLLDEGQYHLSLINVPASEAEEASNPNDGVEEEEEEERPIKNIQFSQDIVDSILGHEDDFVKYQNKIKSHAEKLGLLPEDVFQAVVYGTIPPNINTTNIEDHEIHRRRQQFQKLFLEAAEESEGNPDSPSPNQGDLGLSSQRYNAYMKILKRNKRGIKSWFKKVFKRGKGHNDDAQYSPPMAPPPPPPRRKKIDKHSDVRKSSHGRSNNSNQNVEVDENGDSEVDMLLPTALRRSTYLNKREMIKKMIREEGAFEEEYEKSEEQEQKYRDQTHEPKRRNRRSISQEQDDDLKEGESTTMAATRKITTLSKDEVILINEMVLNLMEIQCEKAEEDDDARNRSLVIGTLGNVRTLTEEIIESSELPDILEGEDRSVVENLFSQLLACTTWWRDANDTYYSEVDRPHRRIKRVRRMPQGEALGWDSISGPGDNLPMPNNGGRVISDEDKAESNMFMGSILRLRRLHSLFYKLTLDNCQPFLGSGIESEPRLLLDSTIYLLTELVKLQDTPPLNRRKELSELFKNYPIDMNADEIANKCYFGI